MARLESMSCALKIFRAQANCHACNAQSSAQNLNSILEKYTISYGEEMRGRFFKRANLMAKNVFRAQKANFPVWPCGTILTIRRVR